ncbi:MAG: DUF2764 family protein [Candidatus Latescibacterota bacterium]
MDKHYYLVAQLPALAFGVQPPLSMAAFLEEAGKWLSAREYAALCRVDITDPVPAAGDPPGLRAYKDLEHRLRTELSLWRGARRGGPDHRPVDFPVQLFEEGNPLEVEVRLLRLRWDFVEQQEAGHHFDFEVLVFYYLKLQIWRRLAAFDKARGLETFRQLREVTV